MKVLAVRKPEGSSALLKQNLFKSPGSPRVTADLTLSKYKGLNISLTLAHTSQQIPMLNQTNYPSELYILNYLLKQLL